MIIQKHQFISPAKIKTLVVPIGTKWSSKKLNKYVIERLKPHQEVKLSDLINSSNEYSTFDPNLFPSGRLFFDFRLSILEDDEDGSLIFLNDFEPFRKTYVVIGVVDSETEYDREFLTTLKSKYPNIICHHIIKISDENSKTIKSLDDTDVCLDTGDSLSNSFCKIGSDFLVQMEKYYKSYEHVTLRSPGAIGGDSVLKPIMTANALKSKFSDTNYLQRSKAAYKLNIDQKLKSETRQKKILGNFLLLTGQYSRSLQCFNETALLSHKLGDYLWLASCLEGISICLVLLTYINYSIPVPSSLEHFLSIDKSLVCVDYKKIDSSNNTPASSERNSVSGVPSPRASASNYRAPFNSNNPLEKSISGNELDSTDILSPISIVLLLKNINDKIIHYYDYTLSHPTEYTPQTVYIDTILRFANVLEYSSLKTNITAFINSIVLGSLKFFQEEESPSYFFQYGRLEIYTYSTKVFEFEIDRMSVFQQLKIYVSLVKLYETLCFDRKRLLNLKNIINILLKQDRPILFEWETKPIHHYLFEYCSKTFQTVEKWGLLEKSLLLSCITLAKIYNNPEKVFEWSMFFLGVNHKYLSEFEQLQMLNDNLLPSEMKQHTPWFSSKTVNLLRDIKLKRTSEDFELPKKVELSENVTRPTDENNNNLFNPFEYLKNEEDEENKIHIDSVSIQCDEEILLEVTLQNPFKFNINVTSIEFMEQVLSYFKLMDFYFTVKDHQIPAQGKKTMYFPIQVLKSGSDISLDEIKIGVFHFQPVLYNSANAVHFVKNSKHKTQYTLIPAQPSLTVNSDLKPLIIHEGSVSSILLTLNNKSSSQIAKIYSITVVLPHLFDGKNKKVLPEDAFQQKLLTQNIQNCLNIEKHGDCVPCNGSIKVKCTLNMRDFGPIPKEFEKFLVDIDYGLDEEDSEYKKNIQIPITISVLKNLELTNMEILPFQRNQLYTSTFLLDENADTLHSRQVIKEGWYDFVESHNDYKWLLFLDIRNTWIEDMTLQLEYNNEFNSESYLLCAKQSKRFVIPINDKIIGKDMQKCIPGSSTKSSLFWIKESLLKLIKCKWTCEDMGNKTGQLDFRRYISISDCKRFARIIPENNVTLNIVAKKTIKVGDVVNLDLKVSHYPCRLTLMVLDSITGRSAFTSNRVLINGNKTFRMIKETMSSSLIFIEAGSYEINCAVEYEDPILKKSTFGSEAIMLSVKP